VDVKHLSFDLITQYGRSLVPIILCTVAMVTVLYKDCKFFSFGLELSSLLQVLLLQAYTPSMECQLKVTAELNI